MVHPFSPHFVVRIGGAGTRVAWYRQSPRQFEPVAFWEWFFPGRVTETDPRRILQAWRRSGSVRVEIRGLFVLPPQVENAFSPAQPPDSKLACRDRPPLRCVRGRWDAREVSLATPSADRHKSAGSTAVLFCRTLDQTWPHEIARAYAWNSEANSSAFPQERHRTTVCANLSYSRASLSPFLVWGRGMSFWTSTLPFSCAPSSMAMRCV
jgi:hypothetical protein